MNAGRSSTGRWIKGVGAAMLATLIACTTTDFVTGQQVKNLFSIQEDVSLGKDLMADIKKEMKKDGVKILKDTPRVAQLQRLVKKLASVSHLPDLPYEVYLFDVQDVNAMALPGGIFMVYQGLYDPDDGLVTNEADLAAILGHEMAHVTCRHSTEELTRHLPANLLLMTAALYAEVKEDDGLAEIIDTAFSLYQGLWVTKYSRQDELEADRVGMMYMAKAGYDPQYAVKLWERVAAREGPDVMVILSTHPTSALRAEKLREALPEAKALYEIAKADKKKNAGKPGQKKRGASDQPGVAVGSYASADTQGATGLLALIQEKSGEPAETRFKR